MIEVYLLGSGGMMPLPDRPLSAAAIRIDGEVILFDCGEGTQVNWRVTPFSFFDLGTILISHVHADHVGGLPGVLFQIAFTGRKDPVRIIGPEGLIPTIEAVMTLVGGLPFDLHLEVLADGDETTLVKGATLSTLELHHRRSCLGYVIDLPRAPKFLPERARELGIPMEHWKTLQQGQKSGGFDPDAVTGPPRDGIRLALVTDTVSFPGLVPFVAESDLLICESTFVLDEDEARALERGHMTLRQAATLAREAKVKELWLTHFSPKVQDPPAHEAALRALFPNGTIGHSGLSTELNYP